MGFYNKELSSSRPRSSVSGCAAPSDSRSLKAFLSPVSLWLQVVIPYFKNRVQWVGCVPEHRNRPPEGKMTPEALAPDLIYIWDWEGVSVQVSANGCLKLTVDIIGLRENCADVQAGRSYKAFKLEEWMYSFLPPIQSFLNKNLPHLEWLDWNVIWI